MGVAAAAAHRPRTTHPRHVRADVERADRPRRPRHRDPARLRPQGKPAPAPGPGTHARHVGTGPVGHLPPLWRFLNLAAATDSPKSTASPPPSRPGGQRSRPPSPPATPTPDRRATTGSPNTKDATPSASGTPPTSADAYAGHALVNTDEHQPKSARCSVKFDEPLNRLSDFEGSPTRGGVP